MHAKNAVSRKTEGRSITGRPRGTDTGRGESYKRLSKYRKKNQRKKGQTERGGKNRDTHQFRRKFIRSGKK